MSLRASVSGNQTGEHIDVGEDPSLDDPGTNDRAFCVGTDLKDRAEYGWDNHPNTSFARLTEPFDLTKPVVALKKHHLATVV